MIKANELRIGNWVSFDLHNKQITDFEILEYASKNGKPIPLTPEILESCGFEKAKSDLNKETSLLPHDNIQYAFTPNYLHQLQNLYFALMGTELEVKLPALSA